MQWFGLGWDLRQLACLLLYVLMCSTFCSETVRKCLLCGFCQADTLVLAEHAAGPDDDKVEPTDEAIVPEDPAGLPEDKVGPTEAIVPEDPPGLPEDKVGPTEAIVREDPPGLHGDKLGHATCEAIEVDSSPEKIKPDWVP